MKSCKRKLPQYAACILASLSLVACSYLPLAPEEAEENENTASSTSDPSKHDEADADYASHLDFFLTNVKLIEAYYVSDFDRCAVLEESLITLGSKSGTSSGELDCKAFDAAYDLPSRMQIYRDLINHYASQRQLSHKLLARKNVLLTKVFLGKLSDGHNALFDFAADQGSIPVGVITHPDGSGNILLVDEGTSAEKYALQAGDSIVSVNGVNVESMSGNDELLLRLHGKPFDVLQLEVDTDDRRRRISMRIQPALPTGMEVSWLDRKRLYWRIYELSAKSRKYARRFFGQEIMSEGKQPLELIIDMRGLKGGDVVGAIELADMFVAKGQLIYGKSKHQRGAFTVPANKSVFMSGVFIKILVDGNTQGAAEVFIATLRRNLNIVEVIGAKTAGHKYVQRRFPTEEPNIFLDLTIFESLRKQAEGFLAGIVPDECLTQASGEDCDQQQLSDTDIKRVMPKLIP